MEFIEGTKLKEKTTNKISRVVHVDYRNNSSIIIWLKVLDTNKFLSIKQKDLNSYLNKGIVKVL